MLNFRNTNIVFVLLLVILAWLHISFGIPYWYFVAALLVYSLILFWGCYYVGSNFFIDITCKGTTEKKEVAITFDDGPAQNHTADILAILAKNNIHAAFFCIGHHVEKNESLLEQVHLQGHIVGNHSYSHAHLFDLFPARKMYADLAAMDTATLKAIGVKPRLFRPPYGVTNPTVRKAIINGNYIPVGWSIRSLDTVITDKQKLLGRVAGVKPGDIILFHDTSKTTVDILQTFIDHVHRSGFTFVRLDKLLNVEPYV
ncbi:polysaccharide deacetylase family protein [Panacibacter sp. DH6]|uniref:Polysaccharide deacetylase family protein n=1 Tax=Panacibacter microcysteis TaxID=2793269 RepID=A0A931GYL7_9BACT|nr:polysaccharide deacetylase family protein [Panacibacter microcysteis]MBG9376662.1 polysaccharide deacetylase family protein [Panacibacter microcysteis]